MSNPTTIPSLLSAIIVLIPSAQCAVTAIEPVLETGDNSTIFSVNGLYIIWAPGNIQTCPTQDQINNGSL